MNNLLKDTIKVKKNDTDYIFYCYIYFLTYFMNQPSLAYKLVIIKRESMRMNKKRSGVKGEADMTFDIELEALIYSLEQLGTRNLQSGAGSLLAFEK